MNVKVINEKGLNLTFWTTYCIDEYKFIKHQLTPISINSYKRIENLA